MQRGFIPVLIIIGALIVVVLIGGTYYFGKSQTPNPQPQQTITPQPMSTPNETSNWKTYTNTKFGFQLKYPKYGEIQDPGCFEAGGKCGPTHRGECGNAIEEVNDTPPYIAIDNFFGIFPESWSKRLTDYIKQKDPKNINTYVPLLINQVPTADEAIQITGYDQSKISEELPFPPFYLVNYIFKKSNMIYSFRSFQNPGSKDGCVSRDKSLNWDIPKSFKFTSN